MIKELGVFFRINSQKTIINTGEPFWNLFFQKKEVPWATHNGKSSKSGLHVVHGAPKHIPKQCFKTEFFEFGNISRDISSKNFVFLLSVANTGVTLRLHTFPAHMKNFPHPIYWRTHNRVSFWNLHGQHEVQIWRTCRCLLLTRVVFSERTAFNYPILYFLWKMTNYSSEESLLRMDVALRNQ